MSTWILIIYMVGGSSIALDHVEFKDKESCESAKEEFVSQSWSIRKTVICVSKERKSI